MTSNDRQPSAGFLGRLFRGEVPLVVTYWVFGILIGGVIPRLILAGIQANYTSLAMDPGNLFWIKAFFWLMLAYALFILIAIWRSAGNYKGPSYWAILARIVVVGNALYLIYLLVQSTNTEHALAEEIKMMNASLPVMVDSETRLDRVAMGDRLLEYYYTLVNQRSGAIDGDRLSNVMRGVLAANACGQDQTRVLLEEDYSLKYIYLGSDQQPITDLTVTLDDC